MTATGWWVLLNAAAVLTWALAIADEISAPMRELARPARWALILLCLLVALWAGALFVLVVTVPSAWRAWRARRPRP